MATYEQLKAQAIAAYKAGDDEKAESIANMLKEAKATGAFTNINGVSHLTATLPKKKERSIGEKIVGAGETALSLATGATGGVLGTVIGTGAGITEQIKREISGKPQMTQSQFEEYASEPAQALTYAPRGEAGKEYLQEAVEFTAPLIALTPLQAEGKQIAELFNATKNLSKARLAQTVENVAPVTQKATEAIKAVSPIAKPKEVSATNIGEIAQKAAKGSTEAKTTLAQEAKINPEALKAAERLDIDMPIDVWSDSELLKQTAGLTRSQVGPESAAWKEAVQAAATKAEDAMASLGGAESKATISGKVQDTLSNSRNELKTQASQLYKEVDESVPKNAVIQPNNLRNTLNEIATELGGEDLMSPSEKRLLGLIKSDQVTYGGLMREKTLIGETMRGKQTPYGNVGEAGLKRLYGAIKQDQLDNVEALGGAEARDKLHFANRLTVKQKALEDRIVGAFGKEGEGSISTLMTRAIEQGAKGDISAMNKVLKAVPKDMHREVMATALADLTTSARAADAGLFDFAKYAKTYQGLRKNAPVYNKLMEAIGPEKNQLLTDLYQVSKRITDARANVLTTGKANQEILKGMQSENLISEIVKKTVSTVANKATAGLVGPDAIFKSPADKVKDIGEMFRSQEFKDLAVESATKQPSALAVKRFVNSKQFKKWASAIADKGEKAKILANPSLWILEAMSMQNTSKDKF